MTKINAVEIEKTILQIFQDTFEQQTGGAKFPGVVDNTVLLDIGLDSLGFAILVTNLEEELEYDPFTLSQDAFYPQTFGEFVQFYYENQPI